MKRRESERRAIERNDDRADPADSSLIDRIGKGYAPGRLAPSARYALERDLWARIESRRPVFYRSMLAMATVVAAVLWFARPQTDSDTLAMAAAVVDAWEYDVLFSSTLDGGSFDWGTSSGLPDDYAGIAAMLEAEENDRTDEENEK